MKEKKGDEIIVKSEKAPTVESIPAPINYLERAINDPDISILDKANLQIEIDKIESEKDKMFVSSFTEDFKARVAGAFEF